MLVALEEAREWTPIGAPRPGDRVGIDHLLQRPEDEVRDLGGHRLGRQEGSERDGPRHGVRLGDEFPHETLLFRARQQPWRSVPAQEGRVRFDEAHRQGVGRRHGDAVGGRSQRGDESTAEVVDAAAREAEDEDPLRPHVAVAGRPDNRPDKELRLAGAGSADDDSRAARRKKCLIPCLRADSGLLRGGRRGRGRGTVQVPDVEEGVSHPWSDRRLGTAARAEPRTHRNARSREHPDDSRQDTACS